MQLFGLTTRQTKLTLCGEYQAATGRYHDNPERKSKCLTSSSKHRQQQRQIKQYFTQFSTFIFRLTENLGNRGEPHGYSTSKKKYKMSFRWYESEILLTFSKAVSYFVHEAQQGFNDEKTEVVLKPLFQVLTNFITSQKACKKIGKV